METAFPHRFMATLRDAEWFDARRADTYRLALLGVTIAVFAGWLALSRHGVDRTGKPLGTDFLAFWSAARLALADMPADAYDLARLYAVERGSMPVDPGISSFLYPPPFLLVCLPLGLMPYFVALAAWLAITGVAYGAALRAWLGARRGWMLTLAAFPAVLSEIGHGQNGFLTATLLGGGLWLLDRRPLLAGALLGCLIVKPQLAFALPVLVIASGRWRVAGAAIGAAGALCLVSLAAFGWGVWHGFLAGSAVGRAILEQGLVDPGKMVSAFAAVRVLHGHVGLGYATQAAVAIGAATLLWRVARSPAAPGGHAATAAAAGLLMSPFLLDYDLTAAAIPLAWLFGEGLRRGFRTWEKLILVAGYVLPLFARDLALTIHLPIAPLVLGALAWAVARAAVERDQIIAMPPLTCSVCPVT